MSSIVSSSAPSNRTNNFKIDEKTGKLKIGEKFYRVYLIIDGKKIYADQLPTAKRINQLTGLLFNKFKTDEDKVPSDRKYEILYRKEDENTDVETVNLIRNSQRKISTDQMNNADLKGRILRVCDRILKSVFSKKVTFSPRKTQPTEGRSYRGQPSSIEVRHSPSNLLNPNSRRKYVSEEAESYSSEEVMPTERDYRSNPDNHVNRKKSFRKRSFSLTRPFQRKPPIERDEAGVRRKPNPRQCTIDMPQEPSSSFGSDSKSSESYSESDSD